ncbi:divergent polysaccharide deacetylase family protein [Shewanella sp. VB17]|nr:divergent polysaccharide deacetylase family protein [Shewanella sp. VB17]NRD71823.1 divergent polysaccharide deacetylase family protein [Shewanella sp. VB17]
MRFFLYFIAVVISSSAYSAQVAIIIDDIGYRQSDEAVLTLPESITLSVLPHTPLGYSVANMAYNKGHEIMVHLPMQALNGKALGPGGLTNAMNEKELKNNLTSAFLSIPFAKGANNHMGSLLTQLKEPMIWVMESLKQNDLYFVDSMTTHFTKAGSTANQLGVPQLKRELFLDNDVSTAALESQFSKLMMLAHNQGQIVAIAHPYPETIQYLKLNLHRLQKAGIKLVKTSELLPYKLASKNSSPTEAELKL